MLQAIFDALISVLGKTWFNALIVVLTIPIFAFHVIKSDVKLPIKVIRIALALAVAAFTLVPIGVDAIRFGFGSWEELVIVLFGGVILFIIAFATSIPAFRNKKPAPLYSVSLPIFFILFGLASFNVIAAVTAALMLIVNVITIATKKHLK